MPSVDGVVRVHAASTPKRKFRLVFALTTLLPWDAPARSMSGQHGHELGGPPSPVERTLLTDSLDRSRLPKTIASGACQKTGATALRRGSRQQNSLMDKTTMLHLEHLPKPHNYSDRFDFIEANRYCSGSKKKPGVHSPTKPWHHWPTKKILPLKIKSASLRQQLEWTASRKIY